MDTKECPTCGWPNPIEQETIASLKSQLEALKKKLLQHETEMAWVCETKVKDRERKSAEAMWEVLNRDFSEFTKDFPYEFAPLKEAMKLWEEKQNAK